MEGSQVPNRSRESTRPSSSPRSLVVRSTDCRQFRSTRPRCCSRPASMGKRSRASISWPNWRSTAWRAWPHSRAKRRTCGWVARMRPQRSSSARLRSVVATTKTRCPSVSGNVRSSRRLKRSKTTDRGMPWRAASALRSAFDYEKRDGFDEAKGKMGEDKKEKSQAWRDRDGLSWLIRKWPFKKETTHQNLRHPLSSQKPREGGKHALEGPTRSHASTAKGWRASVILGRTTQRVISFVSFFAKVRDRTSVISSNTIAVKRGFMRCTSCIRTKPPPKPITMTICTGRMMEWVSQVGLGWSHRENTQP